MSQNELIRLFRPRKLSQVIGQDQIIKQIQAKFKKGAWPHASMFTGHTGCGKTSIAYILARMLGAKKEYVKEINASESRGIDTIRDILTYFRTRPMMGACRVWIIDEAHGLTKDAQNGILKLLEDAPKWSYVILCTTEPDKILKTIKGRCSKFVVKSLPDDLLDDLLQSIVVTFEKDNACVITPAVYTKIIEVADGSAREAVNQLDMVKDLETEEEMLEAIQKSDVKKNGFQLAQQLFNKVKWSDVKTVVREFKDRKEDIEEIRRIVLGYAASVALGGGKQSQRAQVVYDLFRDFFVNGPSDLVFACFAACKGN